MTDLRPDPGPPQPLLGTRVSDGIDAHGPVLADPRWDAELRDLGFTVFPFITPDRLERLRARVEPLVPIDGGPFFSLYRHDTPELRRALHEAVMEEVGPLLEDLLVGQRTFLAGALVKFPGEGSSLALHQDWSFVDEATAFNGSLWLPLESVDERNGGLHAVPGSHRLDQPYRGTPPGVLVTDDATTAAHAGLLTQIDVPSGSAAVYHNALVHGSTENRSDRPRLAVIVGFISEDADLVHHVLAADGSRWRYRVRDDFFFDYEPPATPAGDTVLGVDPISFEQAPVGVEHLDVLAQAGYRGDPAAAAPPAPPVPDRAVADAVPAEPPSPGAAPSDGPAAAGPATPRPAGWWARLRARLGSSSRPQA